MGMNDKKRSMMMLLFTCAFVIYLLSACQTNADSSSSSQRVSQERSPPTLLKVTDTRKNLLFLYVDKEGKEQTVMMINQVPETARAKVQVVDLTKSPEERKSRDFIQLFDLRRPHQEGDYSGRVVRRSELEQVLASQQTLPEQKTITMYSTTWCGVCKKARRFMEDKGLAFIEKDIEKDRAAARELQEKCERAKIPLGGVPIIDVGGQLMRGFDPNRLLSMLKSK